MKLYLKFLLLFLSLVPACGTVARAESNEDMFAEVKSRNAPEVRRLLAAGADVNGRDDLGFTPLFWAALSGSSEIAELLISNGAEVNARDREGFAPLHASAYENRREITELLIRAGAEVNASSKVGYTPLHKAMERLANLEVTRQASPSDVASTLGVVELLLVSGADANARDASGTTPLHNAAALGQKALVELLIAKGADIDAKNKEGVTPLYAAVKMDRAEVAELLIARGAEVDASTKSGYTPLIWAAHRGNRDLVKLLIGHGADVNAKDIKGRSALVWALWTALMLSPSGQAISSRGLSQSSTAQKAEMQKELQKMKRQWREVAKLLIDHGADIAADSKESPPLLMAANLGYKDVVEVLIARGANMNDAKTGETALHAAIAEKHRDVAELLINKGANVNVRNMSGRTPLHFLARDMDDRKLAELMIEHGADINAIDKNGETPLAFANRAGNLQLTEVLRQGGGKPAAAPPELGSNVPREHRLTALFSKTDWPQSRQMIEILREELPRMFVIRVGRDAQLGDGWRAGNRNWEAVHAIIVERVRVDELKNGPLMPLDAGTFARVFEKLGLSDDDIDFLTAFVDTPHGRNTIDVLDHVMVPLVADRIAQIPEFGDEGKARAEAMKGRARESFLTAMSRAVEGAKAQKADEARFSALIDRLGPPQQFGELIGKEIFLTPMQRLAQIFIFDGFSSVQREIEAFRASQMKM